MAELVTLFSADCTPYMDWQSLGAVFSHRKAGIPGSITRLLACDDSLYRHASVVPTFVHQNYALLHPEDPYVPYNKPGSLVSWLQAEPDFQGTLLMGDADMIFLSAEDIVATASRVKAGHAISATYGYLKGVDEPDIVHRFLPDLPSGVVVPKCGGWTMLTAADARCVAPRWLNLTEQVRTAPDGELYWNRMGDAYVTPERPRPWIAEMYGFVFALADCGIAVTQDGLHGRPLMLYPNYETSKPPAILHYGLRMGYGGWSFDKHEHHVDQLTCPPTLFEIPPPPTNLTERLIWKVIDTLNEALLDYGDRACSLPECATWAANGECARNSAFMQRACAPACMPPSSVAYPPPPTPPVPLVILPRSVPRKMVLQVLVENTPRTNVQLRALFVFWFCFLSCLACRASVRKRKERRRDGKSQ